MPRKKLSEEDVLLAALFRAGDRLDKRLAREQSKTKKKATTVKKAKKKAKKAKKAKTAKKAKKAK